MNNLIIRHCGNCGKDMPIKLLEPVQEYKDGIIYTAMCIKGHRFSVTSCGLNIIWVPKGGKTNGNDS
jgi:hypothetical protein